MIIDNTFFSKKSTKFTGAFISIPSFSHHLTYRYISKKIEKHIPPHTSFEGITYKLYS